MEQALSLEPHLAEGHALMAWIQMLHDWDWRGAEASYRRALELAPGNAAVLRRAASVACDLGRLDEAIPLVLRALEQDPLSAHAYSNLGYFLHASGRFTEAEAALRKALELSPQRMSTHSMLSRNLLAQGRSKEALVEAMREPEEWFRLYASAIIYHAAGRRAQSDAALEELIANHAVDCAYQIAEVYAACGDADRAFEWLERAYDQRDGGIIQMKPDPLLRSLHTDPRWDAFLRKMGLAD